MKCESDGKNTLKFFFFFNGKIIITKLFMLIILRIINNFSLKNDVLMYLKLKFNFNTYYICQCISQFFKH